MAADRRRVYFNEFNVLMDRTAYLPLVSGLLAAYASKFEEIKSNYEFMPFLFVRNSVENLLLNYRQPCVAAFSVSVWNEQLNLQVARRLKELFPACLVVFGGPQVPRDSKEYFKKHPFIDLVVHGDGEETLAAILLRYLVSSDFSNIPNISWRDPIKGGYRQSGVSAARAKELDDYPSPYVSGIFDYLFTDSQALNFQAIIETNRGCPYQCAYCVWGGMNKKMRFHSLEYVYAEIEWCANHGIRYVFNADSNFGINERDKQIAEKLAEAKHRFGFPEKFRSCFAKNCEERIYDIAKILVQEKLEKGITLSFQSMDSNVLDNIKRQNIDLGIYKKLVGRFNQEGIPVYSELILGLPGENFKTWSKGVEEILEAGLKDQLFIYPCEVYPNTALSEEGYRKEFGIITKRIRLSEIHGLIRQEEEITEYQDIVISTTTMGLEEWKKMMIFSWLMMFFFSMTVGFFILSYIFLRYKIQFVKLIEFIYKDQSAIPGFLREELARYKEILEQILQGGRKAVIMPLFGNIYWDVEEASFLRLSERSGEFYEQML
ncbi:MAG: radical SAM protein, partial [Candidatus Omnitrophica bacterium]|nr:radical SAM protein [Candidatus Omnitrophota bacterium]